jgi:hypothetical protein
MPSPVEIKSHKIHTRIFIDFLSNKSSSTSKKKKEVIQRRRANLQKPL